MEVIVTRTSRLMVQCMMMAYRRDFVRAKWREADEAHATFSSFISDFFEFLHVVCLAEVIFDMHTAR